MRLSPCSTSTTPSRRGRCCSDGRSWSRRPRSHPRTPLSISRSAPGEWHSIRPEAIGATGFPEHFLSGMVTSHRSRLLGDVEGDDPAHWRWGGPTTDPVHVLLMVYARDAATLGTRLGELVDEAAAAGLRLVVRLDTDELSDREPFGFKDGISQPIIAGLPRAGDSADVVAAGEFVLGYDNEYGQRGERPLLAGRRRPAKAAATRSRRPGARRPRPQRLVPRLPPAVPGRRRVLGLRRGAVGPGSLRPLVAGRQARRPLAGRCSAGAVP